MFTSEGNTNAKGNTIPGRWEKLIKYKYLAPTQKRLPNPLVEGVGVGGALDSFDKFTYLFVIMTFLNICEILLCIVSFYLIVFVSFILYTHCSMIFIYCAIIL